VSRRRTLRSFTTNSLLVPSFKLSTIGSRVFFRFAATRIWSAQPDNVASVSSVYCKVCQKTSVPTILLFSVSGPCSGLDHFGNNRKLPTDSLIDWMTYETTFGEMDCPEMLRKIESKTDLSQWTLMCPSTEHAKENMHAWLTVGLSPAKTLKNRRRSTNQPTATISRHVTIHLSWLMIVADVRSVDPAAWYVSPVDWISVQSCGNDFELWHSVTDSHSPNDQCYCAMIVNVVSSVLFNILMTLETTLLIRSFVEISNQAFDCRPLLLISLQDTKM